MLEVLAVTKLTHPLHLREFVILCLPSRRLLGGLRNPFWSRLAAEQLGVRIEGSAAYCITNDIMHWIAH
ncbi:hypothetical protein [Paenibacillus brasilensis]|uniref:Uncharacterized protein n=1 Tax=Paenibacillus brasilensis TaxID=128574 RepID=A0ABU0KZ93_9BACL|nr:hypothetical protein [Paenibacillus brasilensis]MDQ0494765.1 hypothetical protein [Paenibacillus brasilensis]